MTKTQSMNSMFESGGQITKMEKCQAPILLDLQIDLEESDGYVMLCTFHPTCHFGIH